MLYGNPWIFKNIISYLKDGIILEEPTLEEKLRVIKEHIELEMKKRKEDICIKEMRKHIAWYTKNLPNASKVRQEINQITEKEELIKCLEDYFKI